MKNLTLALAILIGVTGCQSTPEESTTVRTNGQQANGYEQSKQAYNIWVTKINESEKLKFYSSELYIELLSSWDATTEIYDSFSTEPAKANESYSLFSSVTYAQKFDDTLNEVKNNYEKLLKLEETANNTLAESINQLKYLDSLDAAKLFADRYKNIYDDYRALFEAIAENKIGSAKAKQITFLDQTKKLEIDIVLAKYIEPLEKEIELLRKNSAGTKAALSYSRVKTELNEAVAVVKSDTRNLQRIEQFTNKVKLELAHVKHVVNDVKLLSNVKNNKFEPIVLAFENKLLSISSVLSRSDYRQYSTQKQVDLIVSAIKELQANKDIERLTTQLEKLQLFNTAQIEELAKIKQENESLLNEVLELQSKLQNVE